MLRSWVRSPYRQFFCCLFYQLNNSFCVHWFGSSSGASRTPVGLRRGIQSTSGDEGVNVTLRRCRFCTTPASFSTPTLQRPKPVPAPLSTSTFVFDLSPRLCFAPIRPRSNRPVLNRGVQKKACGQSSTHTGSRTCTYASRPSHGKMTTVRRAARTHNET